MRVEVFVDKVHDARHIGCMELLSVTEAAERRRVDPATVRRWCISGALPASKVGSQWVIAVDDLDRFRARPRGNPLWVRGSEKSEKLSR